MKKALLVKGGWQGHEPNECAEIFVPWLKKRGFRVTVCEDMEIYTNARRMKAFDVIIPIWTMGEITGAQSKGLQAAVSNGAGLAGWHGGMCDSFRNDVGYQFMTGGQWVSHPGGIVRYKVKIADKNSPITRNLKDFWIKSEQYYMHTDPGNDVSATTTFSGRHGGISWIKGTVMPVAWTRMFGKGRVAYTSLGHIAADFQVPEVLEIAKRNVQWAARLPIRQEYKSK